MTIVSTGPPPIPPTSSGSAAPRMPSSFAKPRQMSGCQPGPVLAAARLFSRSYLVDRNLPSPSRSSSCSLLRLKSIRSPSSKSESRFGQNVALNLIAAGVDRAGAVVEVAQRRDGLPLLAAEVVVRRWLVLGH